MNSATIESRMGDPLETDSYKHSGHGILEIGQGYRAMICVM